MKVLISIASFVLIVFCNDTLGNTRNGLASTAYVLKCADFGGAQPTLITPIRRAWIKSGLKVPSRASTLDEEIPFHYSNIATYSLDAAGRFLGKIRSRVNLIDFKTGIRLQHDPIGIPLFEDGCETLPLFTKLKNPLPSEKDWIGDLDTWNQLSSVDQMLLLMDKEVFEFRPLGLMLSENYSNLSLKEFTISYWQIWRVGFAFKNVKSLSSCEWWDSNYPKQCEVGLEQALSLNPQNDSKTARNGQISFYPTGEVRWADISNASFYYNGGTQLCAPGGRAWFSQTGMLEECTGFQLDDHNRFRMAWGDSVEFGLISGRMVDIYRFQHLIYNSLGQVLYAGSVGVGGRYKKERGDQYGQFLPFKWWPSRNYKNVTGLYPDGSFRSGVLRHETKDRKGVDYWVEASHSGRFLRKVKLPNPTSYSAEVEVINQLFHFRNTEDSNIRFKLASRKEKSKQIIYFQDTTYASESRCKPRYDKDSFELVIGPKCMALGRIFSVVQHGGDQ